jgi:hypothetical protein
MHILPSQKVSHYFNISNSDFLYFQDKVAEVVHPCIFSFEGESILRNIEQMANKRQYYKYNGIWARNMEVCSFCIVFMGFLGLDVDDSRLITGQKGRLFTYEEVAQRLERLNTDNLINSSTHR